MKLTQEQINELSDWLDEAIDNMDTLQDIIGRPDDVDEALLLGHSEAALYSIREMRVSLVALKQRNRKHKEEH